MTGKIRPYMDIFLGNIVLEKVIHDVDLGRYTELPSVIDFLINRLAFITFNPLPQHVYYLLNFQQITLYQQILWTLYMWFCCVRNKHIDFIIVFKIFFKIVSCLQVPKVYTNYVFSFSYYLLEIN